MTDRLEMLPGGSQIQHGPYNDRIYLMKVGKEAAEDLPETLIGMARERGYSKIFAKVPGAREERFLGAGYLREAVIPLFYNRKDDGVFLGCFLDEHRAKEPERKKLDGIVRLACAEAAVPWKRESCGFPLRRCGAADTAEMAELYRKVFPSYPFPIHDPSYLLATMRDNIVYFAAIADGKLVALSSSETDPESSSVEMTDFATLPEWRGNRLGCHLLAAMENAMRERGIRTAYTIARAASPGMNLTFARLGYRFAGRLRNNTNISGGIESMNVWHKPLM